MYISVLIGLALGSYNYQNHGKDWPGLCTTSTKQSPVDINTKLLTSVTASSSNYWYLDLYYTPVEVINSNSTSSAGTTSGYNYNPGINFSILSNFGKIYKTQGQSTEEYISKAINFHYPAEHTFDSMEPGSSPYVLELQIEHVNNLNNSDVLILSILFTVGTENNYFIDQVISGYYDDIGGYIDCTFGTGGWYVVKNFYSYYGSETKPICNEGVTWVIDSTILTLTQAQLDFFASKLNTDNYGNFRYTMPLYGRAITLYSDTIVFSSGYLLSIKYFILMTFL
jgi:carbonic anhydrase